MNEGVQILLKRMDSNPDEFKDDGKWVSMFNNYKKYMTDEEKTAFMDKLSATRMEQFKQGVLKKLLDEEKQATKTQATKTFRLTSEQFNLVTKLGVPLEEYAKALVEWEKI